MRFRTVRRLIFWSSVCVLESTHVRPFDGTALRFLRGGRFSDSSFLSAKSEFGLIMSMEIMDRGLMGRVGFFPLPLSPADAAAAAARAFKQTY